MARRSARARRREVRDQADEMARLLDRAAPRTGRERRRRSAATPTAVAAFGALTVGGVGLALGLTPTGAQTALPSLDPLPSDGTPAPPMVAGSPRTTSRELLDPAVDPALADASPGTRSGDVGTRAGRSPTRPATSATTAAPRTTSARPGTTSTTTRSTTTTTPRPTTRDAPEDDAPSPDGDAGVDAPSSPRTGADTDAEETERNDAFADEEGVDGRDEGAVVG